MRHVLLIAVALVALSGPSRAAGPFDGNWSGSANASTSSGTNVGSCVATLTATISNNPLRGTEVLGRSTIPLIGTVAPDGSFKSGGGGFIGKFTATSFDGQFVNQPNSDCRNWHATMSRVPWHQCVIDVPSAGLPGGEVVVVVWSV